MSASVPLKGSELIDCAKANAEQGNATACERCGYGRDEALFFAELKRACEGIGVHIDTLEDLITDTRRSLIDTGLEIGPDTPSQL